jgi:hypothetical protein
MGLDATIVRITGPEEREVIADFRKVNFLHAWVQEHLNAGREHNCEEIDFNLEAMAGLVGTCAEVLTNPELGPQLLPTRPGFFFGSTDYDDYYLEDVRHVRGVLLGILNNELRRVPPGSGQYAYWSWW